MNYSQINQLSKVAPPQSSQEDRIKAHFKAGAFDASRSLTARQIGSRAGQIFIPNRDIPFLHNYSQIDFGWKIASRLALLDMDFPIYLGGSDRWVIKAWALLQFGDGALLEEEAKTIHNAWAIDSQKDNNPTRTSLQTMLLVEGATVEQVAQDVGLSKDLVEAYEVLFFNVIGRREDLMFIKNVVYPLSRIEEFIPGYSSSASLEKMSLRTGYNSDRLTALFICGFRPKGFLDEPSSVSAGKFQQSLLQAGAVMAASGMLWLDRSHTTITAARNFVQTAKLSGESMGDDQGFMTLGESFRGELEKLAIATEKDMNARALQG